jgi:hypothetical protein
MYNFSQGVCYEHCYKAPFRPKNRIRFSRKSLETAPSGDVLPRSGMILFSVSLSLTHLWATNFMFLQL